jgi:hypothetical protein
MRNKFIVYSSQITLQRNYSTFTLWRKEKDRKTIKVTYYDPQIISNVYDPYIIKERSI